MRPSTSTDNMRKSNGHNMEPQTDMRPSTVSFKSRPQPSNLTSSSGFRDSINRFEQYASVRRDFSSTENIYRSHLGPGCHNKTDKGRASVPMAVPKNSKLNGTKVPQCFTIFAESNAPPVGTYTLPQIMQPDTYGEMGLQATAPFKSSGRDKQLMLDGKLWQTKRDDIMNSNLGPGSYDFQPSYMGQQIINPTLNDRHYRSHLRTSSRSGSVGSLGSHFGASLSQRSLSRQSVSSATPWRQSSSVKSASVEHHMEVCIPLTQEERERHAREVRNLPEYR